MKVSEKMTGGVQWVGPDETMQAVAGRMAGGDIGALPVGENDKVVGMVTDRDIAVRGVAQGKGPDTPVREVMTPGLHYCFEDEEVEDVARTMAEEQVRRLPVMSRDKRLVGMLSLGDLATSDGKAHGAEALAGVSRHGGSHSQAGETRA
jgi:CBS domain-containing protein